MPAEPWVTDKEFSHCCHLSVLDEVQANQSDGTRMRVVQQTDGSAGRRFTAEKLDQQRNRGEQWNVGIVEIVLDEDGSCGLINQSSGAREESTDSTGDLADDPKTRTSIVQSREGGVYPNSAH